MTVMIRLQVMTQRIPPEERSFLGELQPLAAVLRQGHRARLKGTSHLNLFPLLQVVQKEEKQKEEKQRKQKEERGNRDLVVDGDLRPFVKSIKNIF